MIERPHNERQRPNALPRPAVRYADAVRRAAASFLAVMVSFVICEAAAAQAQIVDGIYLRYESTQYESIFLPCSSTEVWSIDGGDALHALVDYYRNSRASAADEIRTSLLLDILPVDRVEHPNSQIEAAATVIAVLSISEVESEIDTCRAD